MKYAVEFKLSPTSRFEVDSCVVHPETSTKDGKTW